MTDYSDLAAIVRGTVNAVMGETVTIVPMTRQGGVNSSTFIADPARASFSTSAVPYRLLTGSADDRTGGQAIGVNGSERVPLHMAQDTILAMNKPATNLVEGDRVQRADGSWWAMRAPQTDEVGTCILSIYRSSEIA